MSGKQRWNPIIERVLGWKPEDWEVVDPAEAEDAVLTGPAWDRADGALGCWISSSAAGQRATMLPAGTEDDPMPLFTACEEAAVPEGSVVCFWSVAAGVPRTRRATVYER